MSGDMSTTRHSRSGRVRTWGQFVGAAAGILFATLLALTILFPIIETAAGESTSTVVFLSFAGAVFAARWVGMRLGLFETWLGI